MNNSFVFGFKHYHDKTTQFKYFSCRYNNWNSIKLKKKTEFSFCNRASWENPCTCTQVFTKIPNNGKKWPDNAYQNSTPPTFIYDNNYTVSPPVPSIITISICLIPSRPPLTPKKSWWSCVDFNYKLTHTATFIRLLAYNLHV